MPVNALACSLGDGGPATAAELVVAEIAIDRAGNIYCTNGTTVRKINTLGTISTIAGTTGTAGFSGDGGLATVALLDAAVGIIADSIGNIYMTKLITESVKLIVLVSSLLLQAAEVVVAAAEDMEAMAARQLRHYCIILWALGQTERGIFI